MLYPLVLTLVFLCGFGLPFATKRMPVAIVFLVVALVLFFAAIPVANFANDQETRSIFLVVLAFSALPFAAGALARVITLAFFANKEKEWIYVAGVGVVTSILFLVAGTLFYGAAVV